MTATFRLRNDIALPSGYTLAEVHQLAITASGTVQSSGAYTCGAYDRYEVAFAAIVERLYQPDLPCEPGQLVWEGRKAIYRSDRAWMHDYGVSKRDPFNGRGSMPAFLTFWGWGRTAHSPEESVIEVTALRQIWPLLTDRQQQALTALAVSKDYQEAAERLGVSYSTFTGYVAAGRRRFYDWWHEGERPARVWRIDKRVARLRSAV